MFGNKVESNTIQAVDRKRIFIFVATAYGIAIITTLVLSYTGGVNSNFAPVTIMASIIYIFVLGFAPALANIATRLITHEGWSNTYLRPNLRHGWPFYLAAGLLPLLAIILGGAIYYLLFPDRFDLSMAYAREIGKISATDTLANVLGEKALQGFYFIPVSALLLFIGEEFGWRAYLLPKLMPLGPRKAVLLVGVIWGAWHWPMIIMGLNYGSGYWGAPISALLLFVLIIISPSALFSWVTLRTGSVWPACIAHAENNFFSALMVLFLVGKPDVLIGPSNEGIVGCLGYVLLALLIFLNPHALAPVDVTLSKNPIAVEKAAEQLKLGTSS